MPTRAELLRDTEFVVEATEYEELSLFSKYAEDSIYDITLKGSGSRFSTFTWNRLPENQVIQIGSLPLVGPVTIACSWTWINGKLIMFFRPISTVVHWGMIDQWFVDNCNPTYDQGRRLARTDANNFHNVIHFVQGECR